MLNLRSMPHGAVAVTAGGGLGRPYRLASVCVMCARVVRADWDQCIDLGAAALESAAKEQVR